MPVIQESIELARMGIIPGGAYDSQAYVEDSVRFDADIKQEIRDVMFDPQTSGVCLYPSPRIGPMC